MVFIGFMYRSSLLRYIISDNSLRHKKVIGEIFAVIFVTILWGNNAIKDNGDDNVEFIIFIFFIGYCLYAMMKQMPRTGYSESVLLMIKGFMVTALSFMSFPGNILMVVSIIASAKLAYIYWPEEKKSDYLEIIMLSLESFIISLYIYFKGIDSPTEIAVLVIFIETALYMINCLLKYVIVWLCDEDLEDYEASLMGLE